MITRNPSSQIFCTMNHCRFLTHLYFSLLAKQPMVSWWRLELEVRS